MATRAVYRSHTHVQHTPLLVDGITLSGLDRKLRQFSRIPSEEAHQKLCKLADEFGIPADYVHRGNYGLLHTFLTQVLVDARRALVLKDFDLTEGALVVLNAGEPKILLQVHEDFRIMLEGETRSREPTGFRRVEHSRAA